MDNRTKLMLAGVAVVALVVGSLIGKGLGPSVGGVYNHPTGEQSFDAVSTEDLEVRKDAQVARNLYVDNDMEVTGDAQVDGALDGATADFTGTVTSSLFAGDLTGDVSGDVNGTNVTTTNLWSITHEGTDALYTGTVTTTGMYAGNVFAGGSTVNGTSTAQVLCVFNGANFTVLSFAPNSTTSTFTTTTSCF